MIMPRTALWTALSLVTALFLSACDSGEAQDQAAQNQKPSPPAIHQTEADPQDGNIRERYWKLVELRGQPVAAQNNEPHMILKAADNTVNGSGGCNRFHGGYELSEPNRIRFTQMASTMMACMDGMETEQEFLKVLDSVDNYTLQGDHLTLNRARMAPLARFEAVYLR